MEPKEAIALLTQVLTKDSDFLVQPIVAQSLTVVAARMEPKAAVTFLRQAMNQTADAGALGALAQALAAAAARLEPKQAAEAATEAAALLTQATIKNTNSVTQAALAQGLAAVAGQMAPQEAARTAALLMRAMNKTPDSEGQRTLLYGLAAVAARMEPKEGVALLSQIMNKTSDGATQFLLAKGLAAVAVRIDHQDAARVAAFTCFARTINDEVVDILVNDTLSTPYTPLLGRIEIPDLVEQLKLPLCVGKVRRLVLDELGKRYQHRFADQWDFVRFAKEQNLGFEFAGPPKIQQTTELKFP
jgi:hypothetical protein